jgi:Flp pilus assembly protein TadD
VTKISTATESDRMVEFKEGVTFLKNDYPEKALPKLRRAYETDQNNPYYISFLGLALARGEQKWDEASQLCERAIQLKRTEIQFHMNLVEVYALAGRRDHALLTLDYAAKSFGNDRRLTRVRGKLIKRRNPLISIFGRQHFLNRALGELRHRILERLHERDGA